MKNYTNNNNNKLQPPQAGHGKGTATGTTLQVAVPGGNKAASLSMSPLNTPLSSPSNKSNNNNPANSNVQPKQALLQLEECLLLADAQGLFRSKRSLLCKDRTQWAIYYEMLDCPRKAQVLYLKALEDLSGILVREEILTNTDHQYAKLHRILCERIGDLSVLLDKDEYTYYDDRYSLTSVDIDNMQNQYNTITRSKKAVSWGQVTSEWQRNSMLTTSTNSFFSDHHKTMHSSGMNRFGLTSPVLAVRKWAAELLDAGGMDSFVSGQTAKDFQRTFRQKASIRRTILEPVQRGAGMDVHSIRRRALDKTLREMLSSSKLSRNNSIQYFIANFPLQDETLSAPFSRTMELAETLVELSNDPSSSDIDALVQSPIMDQIFHCLVLPLFYPTPLPASL